MICTDEHNKLLDDYLGMYGIPTSEDQRDLMLRHLDLVVEKNRVMNLTRIVDPQDAIIRHLVDSLLLVPTVKGVCTSHSTEFVDIGTGAGFPGVPLCIATGFKGTLIDSVGKKARAVEEFIGELGLSERSLALPMRAEELARMRFETYRLVVARAVADFGVLVEYASPLLEHGGHLIVSKAHISPEELERGKKTGDIVGLEYVSRETYELPLDRGHREILCMQKTSKSKRKLPRSNGLAKSKPLVAS